MTTRTAAGPIHAPRDPLSEGPESAKRVFADRVFYATGVLLDAQDFGAEQTYHRSRLARALAYLHGSGTAAGLRVDLKNRLTTDAELNSPRGLREQLVVEPGLAVDRLGRLIEVPRLVCIRLNRWYQEQPADALFAGFHGAPYNGVVVDVFVRFVVCERGKTPAFAAGPFDALDAVAPARLRDSYELSLVIRKEAEPPLPASPWPDLASETQPAARRTLLRDAILNAWREGSESWDDDGPVKLREHVVGQDTTSLFLARLVLPATPPAAGTRPTRTTATPVQINNEARPFVLTTAALARQLGL